MAIQYRLWLMFRQLYIHRVNFRPHLVLCVAVGLLVAGGSTAAAQENGGLSESFEDFMKNLGGGRPTSEPSTSQPGSRPRQPTDTGAERRGPAYTNPRADTDPGLDTGSGFRGRQPSTRFPGSNNSELIGPGGIPSNRSLRPGSSSGVEDREYRRRGLPAERPEDDSLYGEETYEEEKLDWKQQSTSIADLRFPTSTVFRHGDAWLEPEEETAYVDLVTSIARQRERLLAQVTRDNLSTTKMKATWEESFYQYAHARQLAWNNGHLRDGLVTQISTGLLSPFRGADAPAEQLASTAPEQYLLQSDFTNFAEDFVGRPIVLMGVFTKNSTARIPNELKAERPVSGRIPDEPIQLTVMRGTLTAIGSSRKIATIDTQNITFPDSVSGNSLSLNSGPIPVLVKGWVVKNWDGKPLIYSETVRLLSPIPHDALIRNSTIDKRRLQEDEKWIYYETLNQLKETSAATQSNVAARVLGERIDGLMREVSSKAAENLAGLKKQLKLGKISDSDYRSRKTSLERQVSQRIARYRRFRKHPDAFQTYVDVFQNPEVWHGKLLTLSGHVRHVVSYPSDNILFDGEMLHELWLFTDDSQHNPAVIVTPHLPTDFPTDAEVVDSVSVTGCFFKRYVYGSQDSARIAPLILAGKIDWRPTVDQVEQLVKDGNLGAGSVRAQKAADLGADKIGETAMTLISIFVVLVLMVLWGRAQREERDRIRLRKRVDEVPVFESPLLPGYTAAHTEFISDSDNGVNFPY